MNSTAAAETALWKRNTLTFLLHTYFRHVTADNAQVPTTNDNFVHVTRTDSVNNPTTHSMCCVLARSSPGILPKVFKQVLQHDFFTIGDERAPVLPQCSCKW